MKIQSLSDIDKLPSVLDVEEVSQRLIELIRVLRDENIDPLQGAMAINDLLSYRGYSDKEISIEASIHVLEWTKENYEDENRPDLVEWSIANVANMQRELAMEFLIFRLSHCENAFETRELTEALNEIGVKAK